MSEHAVELRTSRSGRWLAQRRLWIALWIAILEGIVVAIEDDVSRWAVIGIAAPMIILYLWTRRSLGSDTGRQLLWIAAASQTFAVLVVIFALVISWLAILLIVLFALAAVFFLFVDRSDRAK